MWAVYMHQDRVSTARAMVVPLDAIGGIALNGATNGSVVEALPLDCSRDAHYARRDGSDSYPELRLQSSAPSRMIAGDKYFSYRLLPAFYLL